MSVDLSDGFGSFYNISAEDDMESKINELSNIIEKAINVK